MNLINTPRYENGTITTEWETFDSLPQIAQYAINIAIAAIYNNHFVNDRVIEIEEKTDRQFLIEELPMGSGGVGQLKILKSQIRFQIGYGHSKHNYAKTLIIEL